MQYYSKIFPGKIAFLLCFIILVIFGCNNNAINTLQNVNTESLVDTSKLDETSSPVEDHEQPTIFATEEMTLPPTGIEQGEDTLVHLAILYSNTHEKKPPDQNAQTVLLIFQYLHCT